MTGPLPLYIFLRRWTEAMAIRQLLPLDYDQSTAKLTAEEQKMREENLIARTRFQDSAMRRLATTICLHAVIRYRKARRKLACFHPDYVTGKRVPTSSVSQKINHLKKEISECECFFCSDMFALCSGCDNPEWIQSKIDKLPPDFEERLERRMAR